MTEHLAESNWPVDHIGTDLGGGSVGGVLLADATVWLQSRPEQEVGRRDEFLDERDPGKNGGRSELPDRR